MSVNAKKFVARMLLDKVLERYGSVLRASLLQESTSGKSREVIGQNNQMAPHTAFFFVQRTAHSARPLHQKRCSWLTAVSFLYT